MNTIALVLVLVLLLLVLLLLLTLIAELLGDVLASIITASRIFAWGEHWIPSRQERGGQAEDPAVLGGDRVGRPGHLASERPWHTYKQVETLMRGERPTARGGMKALTRTGMFHGTRAAE
jgi:hypothetical protein